MASEFPVGSDEPPAEEAEAPKITRSDRRTVEMRAYAVRYDDSIIDLRVLDLSYDGCGIETTAELIPGELLKLSVLGRGIVDARVRWCKHRKAGLLFDPEPRAQQHRERAAERLDIAAEVSLRRSGRISYPVRTFDLTRLGCGCEFVERPEINERVWVKFAGMESLASEVCWIAGSSLGLKFNTPIHPAVFDLLLSRLEVG
jgi:hypothetical protein